MSKIFEQSLSERQRLATSILEAAVERERLANAYMFIGRGTADKWSIVRQLAAFLNCLSRSEGREQSCLCQASEAGSGLSALCQNCRWINDNQHPQALLTLAGEDTSKTGKVPVEKARLLAGELTRTSQYCRTVVIPDAGQDIFHRPAANALLKTIEEPGPGCLFCLFATHPEEVLPTIVSRCQVLPVPISARAGLWLEEQDRAAVAVIGDAVDVGGESLSDSLSWSAHLSELAQQGVSARTLIDVAVSREVERLRSAAANDPSECRYLRSLTDLAETSKHQIDHFVAPKFALEAFGLSWRRLRLQR